MATTLPGALRESASGGLLRMLRVQARRVFADAALTLTGLWRAAALVIDGMFVALDHEWAARGRGPPAGAPRATVVGWRPVAWLSGVSAGAARALHRLTAAHLRLVVRVDERLIRLAA